MRPALPLMILLAALCANAMAEPIGRLFFTPQQRSQMDRLRESNGGPVAAESQTITVNGLVRRSSGKDTAWINRAAREAHDVAASGATGRAGRGAPAVAVELPSGKNVNLKTGQSYDLNSGRVSEPYENSQALVPETGAPVTQGK